MHADQIIELIAAITALLWLALVIMLRGRAWEMDAGGIRYSFHTPFNIYRQIYMTILIAGTVLSLFSDDPTVRVVLVMAAIYAMVFMIWLNFCYEHYQHVRYRNQGQSIQSPYKGWQYAFTLVLGTLSPLLLAAGLLRLAYGQ